MKFKKFLSFLIFSTLIGWCNAQTLTTENLVFDGNNREYALYVPTNYDGTTPFPLLFNFHGGGDFIATHMASIDMRPIADTANFIVVYPQAIPDPGNGGSTSWMHKEPTTHNDVPFVAAMIDAISQDYSIKSNQVYACGYSLGGEFTYELACQLNNKIAAIGAVARTMGAGTFNNCAPVHPTGVMTILGTADAISNYDGITYQGVQYYMSAEEQNNYWANYNNCNIDPTISSIPDSAPSDGSTVERYTWANADDCVYVEELKVINGDHDWPGSNGNMDIDASQEIWNFVSQYDINGLIDCSTPTSINDFPDSPKDYKIYPNPLNDKFTIEIDGATVKTYKIYNLIGELIITGRLTSGVNTINLSSLKPNVYLLNIDDQSIKLIKTD